MTVKSSYWPEDLIIAEPPSQKTPARFLEEIAQELPGQTEGLLRAEVEEGSWGEYLVYDFVVVAPALDDYAYRLFKVRHRLAPYPAEIIHGGRVAKAAGPGAFEERLRTILAAAETRRAISELLLYSRERRQRAA